MSEADVKPDTTGSTRKRKWDEPGQGQAAEPSGKSDGSPAGKLVKVDQDEIQREALDAAAEIAARLGMQHAKPSTASSGGVYVQDGREAADPEFVKDIEINDLRNRYVLTKGATQQQIFADTGANVTTKGVWYPDKSMSTDKDPPLYLHVTAETKDKLQAGIEAVQKLIDQELGPLIDERRFRNRDRDEPRERRKWAEEKIMIELEPLRNFNVRAKVVGPGGLFVKYIQQETQTRVQIKGQGSGFVETETGRESEDPMHIHVTGPEQVMVDKGTEMAKDLLVVVKEEHAKARAVLEQGFQQQQQQFHYQQHGGGGNYGPPGQGWAGQHQQQQGGAYGGAYGQQQSPYGAGVTAPLPPGEAPPAPPPPPADGTPGASQGGGNIPAQQAGGTATAEQWAAYWNSLDPASQAYYTQYYAQAYQQPQAPAPPSSAPPPPPPPPSGSSNGGQQQGGKGAYGAVPPPPGL